VHASYAATRGRGYVLCYAGTTPARASETLEVLVRELDRWGRGVSRDEFRRARVGMKAHLVMQGESTAARAHAVAAEQYVLGAPRTLERLSGLLDDMELEEVNRVLTVASLRPMTLVTVGPEALAAAGMAAGAPGRA
jgi:predicted Zn-dependent peptidase